MKKQNTKTTNLHAFTLSELLVVLVIVGILILIALPQLMPLISKARSIEAKQALKHVHTLQKTYFFEFSKYSDDLKKIGFEQDRLITDENGGNANYLIELANSTPTSYLVRATAVVDFDGDGEYNVWEINQEGELLEIIQD
jgi:type IV pilus assembly protein PilE